MGVDKEIGVIVFIISVNVLASLMFVGYKSTSDENTRIYNKCLVELQDKPYKQAVEICKDRVE